jgi:putative addiction module component (TIGR02574 family)
MANNLADVETKARSLSTKERAPLVRRLIITLENENDGDVERQWFDEAERRLAAYRRGETSAHPGEDVFDTILNRS